MRVKVTALSLFLQGQIRTTVQLKGVGLDPIAGSPFNFLQQRVWKFNIKIFDRSTLQQVRWLWGSLR